MAHWTAWGKRAGSAVLAILIGASIAACGGGGGGGGGGSPPAATAPTITTPPANVTVTAGQSASFTVVAAGTAPLTYQWRRNGTPIANATATTYATPATVAGDSGATFDVVVTNSAGAITSRAATLTVNAAPPPVTGPYKRIIAALLANTYNVGCTNGAGAATGPVVVEADGDVTWDGGGIDLATPFTSASVGNTYSSAVRVVTATIEDTNARTVAIEDRRTAAGRTASVIVTEQNTIRTRCSPGVATDLAQTDLAQLVATWLEGADATLTCTVQQGGTTDTRALRLTAANGQITLGGRTLALTAARIVDGVGGGDGREVNGDVKPAFSYEGRYTDNALLRVTRWDNSTRFMFKYTFANGDEFDCMRL